MSKEGFLDESRIIGSDAVGALFSDVLLLTFDKACRGTTHLYMNETDDMYESMLSVVLAAFTTSTPVYPAVITSETLSSGSYKAEKLYWLRLQKL